MNVMAVARMAKARFRFSRLNQVALAEYAHLDPAQLITFMRAYLDPQGSTARFNGGVGLVHQQDIRRPLGMPRSIPDDRLRYALPFAVTAPPLRGFWHARGVRLVAPDIDWTRGNGPEARGSAEAVLMVLAGRAGVAQELAGPGADLLRRRLGLRLRQLCAARRRRSCRSRSCWLSAVRPAGR